MTHITLTIDHPDHRPVVVSVEHICYFFAVMQGVRALTYVYFPGQENHIVVQETVQEIERKIDHVSR